MEYTQEQREISLCLQHNGSEMREIRDELFYCWDVKKQKGIFDEEKATKLGIQAVMSAVNIYNMEFGSSLYLKPAERKEIIIEDLLPIFHALTKEEMQSIRLWRCKPFYHHCACCRQTITEKPFHSVSQVISGYLYCSRCAPKRRELWKEAKTPQQCRRL